MSKPIRANDNDKLPAVIASADPRDAEKLCPEMAQNCTSRTTDFAFRATPESDDRPAATVPAGLAATALPPTLTAKKSTKSGGSILKRKVVAAAQRAAKRN